MYHRIKHRIKQSRLIQYTLILIFTIIIVLLPYPGQPDLKQWEINEVSAIKDCLVVTGLPTTLEDCAKTLGVKAEKATESAEHVFMWSESNKEKAEAAIVLSNFSGAKEILEKLVINDTSVQKDLAFASINLREYGRAAELCESIIQEEANDTFCLDVLGISYYTMNRNKESFEYGKKAYDLYPHPCRYLNLGLEYGNTGNISEAKRILDEVIKTNKDIVLSCWSPIKTSIAVSDIDRYNLCFLNDDKSKSICRAFAREGWVEGNTTKVKTPAEIQQEEEQKKLLEELNQDRVL
ncbi:MAG: hypothetical protein PHO02_01955 [Candidatus Nanoarchaeia archaeon]|nr:hypothetical protein [Candidatus Nanoarchaeia archaeon]